MGLPAWHSFFKNKENDCYERKKNEKQIPGKTSRRISTVG